MRRQDGETTDAALLDRLGDWADRCAWDEFVRRYDAAIRRHCRAYRFDAETTEELCQRIWVELAGRMRTYRYDPGRRFRGWLRMLCRSRAVDLWRQRRSEPLCRLDDVAPEGLAAPIDLDFDEGSGAGRPALLRQAEEVQEAVRRRVDDRTWRAFWSIAVEGSSIRETAESAGLSYAAAFAAQKRVRRMLREEAQRPAADTRP